MRPGGARSPARGRGAGRAQGFARIEGMRHAPQHVTFGGMHHSMIHAGLPLARHTRRLCML